MLKPIRYLTSQNRLLPFGALLILSLLFSGCATTGSDGLASSPAANATTDQEYMWKVEQAARRQMVDVVWVHPPRKDQKNKDADPADS